MRQEFLHQYEDQWPYLRDIHQTHGVGATVNLQPIKRSYYQEELVAVGSDLDYEAPHDRDRW